MYKNNDYEKFKSTRVMQMTNIVDSQPPGRAVCISVWERLAMLKPFQNKIEGEELGFQKPSWAFVSSRPGKSDR